MSLDVRDPESSAVVQTDQEGIEPAAPAVAAPLPVAAGERLDSVDALRGFALLGILAMNIVDFAWPGEAYSNPSRLGGFGGFERGVWIFNHLVFEAKMMTIFSMLFGAGLVLMDQRACARGATIRGVYFSRILWLLLIGLVHAYLIWSGDILVLYAQTGLFLYFFRASSPRTLIILGICASLVLVPIVLGFTASIDYMKAAAQRVEAHRQAGESSSWLDTNAAKMWGKMHTGFDEPTPEKRQENWNKELAAYRGGYLGIVKHRAGQLIWMHTLAFVFGLGFLAASRMLIGMGLMKLGVFSAARSDGFYAWMVGLGYGIGLPLMVYDAYALIQHSFSGWYMMHGGLFYNTFGSIVVALGHVGLLMLMIRHHVLEWLTRRLAAVGRMALSNYLTHSIVCTTIFYGYGFNLYGRISRPASLGIVIAIWVAQLLYSPIWLRYFRYGPAEWLWRSLTYWHRQPFRNQPAVAASAP